MKKQVKKAKAARKLQQGRKMHKVQTLDTRSKLLQTAS